MPHVAVMVPYARVQPDGFHGELLKGRLYISYNEAKGGSGWWFQRFFIFTPTWGRFPFWLIYFKWVETTNQGWVASENGFMAGENVSPPNRSTPFEIRVWNKALLKGNVPGRKLGSMDRINGLKQPTYTWGYIGVTTHLLNVLLTSWDI